MTALRTLSSHRRGDLSQFHGDSPFLAISREISPRTLRPDSERGEQLPALEHFYVVCPAVVDDKARPGFESWWQEATTDDVLF